MPLRRYSSPPRSSSSSRSDVGWKLRERYLRQNHDIPLALYSNKNNSNREVRIPNSTGELGIRNSGMARSARVRNRSFSDNRNNGISKHRTPRSSSSLCSASSLDKTSCHSSSTRSSYTRRSRLPNTDDTIDPSLPPAFRVALRIEQQRRRRHKEADDASCLGSVASHCSTTANSTACDVSLDDDSDLCDSDDDADSFASIESDADEDDDALRESRNQLAKAEHEMKNSRRRPIGSSSRFSSNLRSNNTNRGVLGVPLGLIVEER